MHTAVSLTLGLFHSNPFFNTIFVMSIEFISVDKDKLRSMTKRVWCDLERPIVACSIDFKFRENKKWKSGCLLFTRGAIYIFKLRVLRKMKYYKKLHILDVRDLIVRPGTMTFVFDSGSMYVKSENVGEIASAMVRVLNEAIFGLKNLTVMHVDSTVPLHNVDVTSRPQNALKWRALLLAHFYDVNGKHLHELDYFDRWEVEDQSYLMLEPTLHPGNFAAAFGHAIAWESKLDMVVFRCFAPRHFPRFLDSLIDNATTIKTVIFDTYDGTKDPVFSGSKIEHSSVSKYIFEKVTASVITEFLRNTMKYPQIEELTFNKIEVRSDDFTRFVDLLTDVNNLAVHDHLQSFTITYSKILRFPTGDITRLLRAMPHIHSITIQNCNGSADRFVNACFVDGLGIKSVRVSGMTFKTAFDNPRIRIPPSLVSLDVSGSKFYTESLAGLMRLLTTQEVTYPIVLQMRRVLFKDDAMNGFGQLNLEATLPNIAEIDLSNTVIPSGSSQRLFAFLFTQKRLRLVSFKSVQAEDPIQFLKYVLQLCSSTALPGLELSGNFDSTTFGQFLNALLTTGAAKSLRRLDIAGSKSGTTGMGALNELIKTIPGLNELVVDGFETDNPAALYALWKTISQHPEICSCDLPTNDMRQLGLILTKTPEEFRDAFQILSAKSRPLSVKERVEFAVNRLSRHAEYVYGPDIFKLVALEKLEEQEQCIE